MPLRLLAIDLPPLARDLVARALDRRDQRDEAIFIELPRTGANVEAIAVAAEADAVLTSLDGGDWPDHCSAPNGRRARLPLFGLAWDAGRVRFSEMRTIESSRIDGATDGVSIDELVDRAAQAAERAR